MNPARVFLSNVIGEKVYATRRTAELGEFPIRIERSETNDLFCYCESAVFECIQDVSPKDMKTFGCSSPAVSDVISITKADEFSR